MQTREQLKTIAKYAIDENEYMVRELLTNGVDLNLSRLFVEGFHSNFKASIFIKKQATCKDCGGLAKKHLPEPICALCSFNTSMQNIEYGKSKSI
jgi:hypothetical protein